MLQLWQGLACVKGLSKKEEELIACPVGDSHQSDNQQDDGHNYTFDASSFVLDASLAGARDKPTPPARGPAIMEDWILLDTGLSTDIFCDKGLLTNMTEDPTGLTLHTNGGVLESNECGDLPIYGRVWHDARALTNILSFFNLQKKFHVTFDNAKDDAFHVFTKDKKELCFSPSPNGIYRYDNRKRDFCFTETVHDNAQHFTTRQIEKAKLAHKLYYMLHLQRISECW